MTAKRDRQRFRVFDYKYRNGSLGHQVRGTKRDGTRVRQVFSNLADALKRSGDLEAEYQQKAPPKLAPTTLAEPQLRRAELALERLGGKGDLVQAVDFFLAHWRDDAQVISLDSAKDKFLTAKEKLHRRPATLRGLRDRVGRFCRFHKGKNVGDITLTDIEQFCSLEGKGDYARISDRRVLHTFFAWCVKRGYCLRNPATDVEVPTPPEGIPPVLPAVRISALLNEALNYKNGVMLPFFVLSLYCGMRREEIFRLHNHFLEQGYWVHDLIKQKLIRLEGNLAKKRQRRDIPVPEIAITWLEAAEDVDVILSTNFRRDFDAVKEGCGFVGRIRKPIKQERKNQKPRNLDPWPGNILRHTAISFHFQLTNHEGQTAKWAGTSPDVIQTHYKGLISQDDCDWFWKDMKPM